MTTSGLRDRGRGRVISGDLGEDGSRLVQYVLGDLEKKGSEERSRKTKEGQGYEAVVESDMQTTINRTYFKRGSVLEPDTGETVMSTEALIRGTSSSNRGQFAPARAPACNLCQSRLSANDFEVIWLMYTQLSKRTL